MFRQIRYRSQTNTVHQHRNEYICILDYMVKPSCQTNEQLRLAPLLHSLYLCLPNVFQFHVDCILYDKMLLEPAIHQTYPRQHV